MIVMPTSTGSIFMTAHLVPLTQSPLLVQIVVLVWMVTTESWENVSLIHAQVRTLCNVPSVMWESIDCHIDYRYDKFDLFILYTCIIAQGLTTEYTITLQTSTSYTYVHVIPRIGTQIPHKYQEAK